MSGQDFMLELVRTLPWWPAVILAMFLLLRRQPLTARLRRPTWAERYRTRPADALVDEPCDRCGEAAHKPGPWACPLALCVGCGGRWSAEHVEKCDGLKR